MGKPKHTPGPWRSFVNDSGGRWSGWPLSVVADHDEGKVVVRTGGQWPYEWDEDISQQEAVANARLIAASPDLLSALREVEYALVNSGRDADHDGLVARARAAIAKATEGER